MRPNRRCNTQPCKIDCAGKWGEWSACDKSCDTGTGTGGGLRARSHCCFAPPLIHFIPDSRTSSVPLFLKRQCDQTLGGLQHRAFKISRFPDFGGERRDKSDCYFRKQKKERLNMVGKLV